MKLLCCWLFAIDKYGFPPSMADTYKALEEMKELGFSYVELEGISVDNLEMIYEKRYEIKKYTDELGLKVANFVPVIPEMREFKEEKRQLGLDLFEKGLEIAATLNTEFIQLDSFPPMMKSLDGTQYDSENVTNFGAQWRYRVTPEFNWGRQWGILVENIKWSAQKAAEFGLRLIIEPRVGEIISNTDGMLRLIDAVDENNLGSILDTGHQFSQKEILPLSILKLNERLMYLHLSDNNSEKNDHLIPGDGTIDWVGVFEALKMIDYNGFFGIDIAKTGDDLSQSYRKAMVRLREYAEEVDF